MATIKNGTVVLEAPATGSGVVLLDGTEIALGNNLDPVPGQVLVHGPYASGTNLTGGQLSLAPGLGTGSGVAGNLVFAYGPAGSSGVTQNTPTMAMTINGATGRVTISSVLGGFVLPSLTVTQRGALASPAAGLMIWNSTNTAIEFYTGSGWLAVTSGAVAS